METLAFLYLAVDYEDPNPAPQLRSFENLKFPISSSVVIGAATVGVMAAATLGSSDNAQALMAMGDRGAGVIQLQKTLGITADGIYGSVTRSTVHSYQVSQNLDRDGIAGPKTLLALGLPTDLNSEGGTGSTTPVPRSAKVLASALIIRSAPDGADTRGRLYRGDIVNLKARSYEGGRSWVQLYSGGWVAEEYLFSESDESGGNPIFCGNVTASVLIVRDAPAGADTGKSLYSGARVSLTGARKYAGGRYWVQLASGNWVAESYISYN
jgi:hypothetical protein